MRSWFALSALTLFAAAAARPQAVAPSAVAQASAGAALYASRCAACHGDAMTGGDHAPALKGAGFWRHWQNAPARPLYSRILSTMPQTDPGSLTPAETLALVAHIVRANGHPLALAARSPDDLNAVRLAP